MYLRSWLTVYRVICTVRSEETENTAPDLSPGELHGNMGSSSPGIFMYSRLNHPGRTGILREQTTAKEASCYDYKNSFLIDPASQDSRKADIRIADGVIRRIDSEILPDASEEVIDASGLVAAPGLIDTHVHFRDPGFTYKETLHTGALSAAKGGFTSVICMANTSPVVDNTQTLLDIEQRAKAEKIRIFQAASVSRSLKGRNSQT